MLRRFRTVRYCRIQPHDDCYKLLATRGGGETHILSIMNAHTHRQTDRQTDTHTPSPHVPQTPQVKVTCVRKVNFDQRPHQYQKRRRHRSSPYETPLSGSYWSQDAKTLQGGERRERVSLSVCLSVTLCVLFV